MNGPYPTLDLFRLLDPSRTRLWSLRLEKRFRRLLYERKCNRLIAWLHFIAIILTFIIISLVQIFYILHSMRMVALLSSSGGSPAGYVMEFLMWGGRLLTGRSFVIARLCRVQLEWSKYPWTNHQEQDIMATMELRTVNSNLSRSVAKYSHWNRKNAIYGIMSVMMDPYCFQV